MFCVGASPYEPEAFEQIVQHNMKGELAQIPCYYCRGAWDLARMSFVDKNLCKMLRKAVGKKDPADYEIWEKALMAAGDTPLRLDGSQVYRANFAGVAPIEEHRMKRKRLRGCFGPRSF